ncbi:DUF421 domain-containing protein [Metabacillus idriensis]|uniref:DUF421 domain-containing protein n=1 Tax=Metabacillus idriensis TaxID=324768 RepID=UPI00281349B8|nr:DUF421 domain-containing protein [Metabacillus idriensis]MDR0138229.1 DUF421 domain-containing protein [Metabacillus idriensis]
MEEHLIIIGRTIFLYFLILIIFRLMGKREIGELSILDLVVFLMIAEMAVMAIENTDDPLIHTVIPMLLLLGIQIGLAYLSLKNHKVRKLLDGKPTIIIDRGKINEHAMKTQRYNFDDLLIQLREKEINDISEVDFAILEPSGKLSVIKKEHEHEHQELQLPLIIDGSIQEENLYRIGKTNFWLRQQLRDLGYFDIKNISFCTHNKGAFFIDLRDEK